MGFGFLDVVELYDENYTIATAAVGYKRASSIAAEQTKRACIALHGRQAGEKLWSDSWSVMQRNSGGSTKQGRAKDKGEGSRMVLRHGKVGNALGL